MLDSRIDQDRMKAKGYILLAFPLKRNNDARRLKNKEPDAFH
jgi:hypothetical protein